MFISGTGTVRGVRCQVPFKVLTWLSRMILHICDVPIHFQESPVWNYFDFQFEDMGYMKKYLVVCQTIDYMQMSMTIWI